MRGLLLPVTCALFVLGPSTSPAAAAPTAAWGFFSYTRDFLSGLSNARLGRVPSVQWTSVEPTPGSGVYSWKRLDAGITSAQKSGKDVVLVLKAGNGVSFSDPVCFQRVEAEAVAGGLPFGRQLASCPITAAMEGAWSRMVGALVERYDADGYRDMPGLNGSIRVDIQVENEADNPELWDFGETDRTLAADRYLRLLGLSYQAKQVVNPATEVILAGMHQPNLLARCDGNPQASECIPFVMDNLAFTKRILARPGFFDAVDVHFFAYYHLEPGFIDSGLQWVVDQMQGRGYQRPIYSLEWTGSSLRHVAEGHEPEFTDYFPYSADFPTVDAFWAMYLALDAPENLTYRQWFEAEQAKEFGKLFASMLALGVRRLVHVQYSDHHEGDGGWDTAWWNWQGVIKYVNGVPIRKPSYYTYNILSERIYGFTGARRIDQGGDVRLYEFTFATKPPVYVLWTDGPQAVLDLSSVMARPTLRLTHPVTALDGANAPVVQPDETVPAAAVPAGDLPVVLEGVN